MCMSSWESWAHQISKPPCMCRSANCIQKKWILGNPEMCTIFLLVFTKAHIADIPFCTLYCWDPGVRADFILICLKWRRAGDTKLWTKSCFLQESLSKTKYWQGTDFQKMLGSALQKNYGEGSWCRRWNLYRETLLITVPLCEEAIDDL